MTLRFRRALAGPLAAAALTLTVAGCGGIPKMPDVEEPPRGDGITAEETRRAIERVQKEAVTVLPTDIRELLPLRTDQGDPIPERIVGPIFVEEMPAIELLRILVRPHDIAVVPSPGLADVSITMLDPVKRPMGEAIAMIADQADLFYTYRGGVLRIDDQRDFTLTLPTLADGNSGSGGGNGDGEGGGMSAARTAFLETFQENFAGLGAENINVDSNAGIVSFEADRRGYRRIAEYVKKFSEEKAVLVYDTWIYSVELREEVGIGIDFSELQGTISDTGVSVTKAPSLTDGVGLDGLGTEMGIGGLAVSLSDLSIGPLAIDAILSFLDNQGDTKALSKPSLTMTSGRAAEIFVGRKQNFIRRVSVQIEQDDDDDGDDDDTATITPEIEELDLGIGMTLSGNYSNGVITSALNLQITDLIALEERTFENAEMDVTLQLPETAERRLNTEISSRPGDIIVLGGLIKDSGGLTGQDLMTVPLSRKEQKRRQELVFIMRPRLVLMRPEGHADFARYMGGKAQPEAPRKTSSAADHAESGPDAPAHDAETSRARPLDPVSDVIERDRQAPVRSTPLPPLKPADASATAALVADGQE